jgi:outer membrane protein
MNNKVSLLLNIILLVAVGILFYLVLGKKSSSYSGFTGSKDSLMKGPGKMAYFELDSLENNYEYYKTIRKAFMEKDSIAQTTIARMKKDFQNRLDDAQKRGASMSQTEQLSLQKELGDMQNSIMAKQQQMEEDLTAERLRKLEDVRVHIQDFLKNYAKEKGYSFVLATSESSDNVYYKDTTRNITAELLYYLNKQDPKLGSAK